MSHSSYASDDVAHASIGQMLQVTRELSLARTRNHVAGTIATSAVSLFGASRGFVVVPTADGAGLEMLAHVRENEPHARECVLPMDAELPVVDAYRQREVVLLHTNLALAQQYPSMVRDPDRGALAALPLVVDDHVVGAIVLTFPVAQHFAEEQRSMLLVLADLAAQALRRAELEGELESLKRDFVVTASHELRTPLAAIYGAGVTLEREDVSLSPELGAQLRHTIVTQADRLRRILDDLLVTGELDSGTLRLEPEWVDPATLVGDAVAHAHADCGGQVSVELHVATGTQVMVDAGRVQQVLANLVENACKYSPAREPVQVRVAVHDDALQIEVVDAGIGMTAAQCERAFDKFYRVDPHQRSGVSGTGLGLFICRELVTRMGGRVQLRPNDGAGTTATIVLPAPVQCVAAAD